MKSKKWLISLGLAVVLVVAFALPACEPTPDEYWYTPGGEKISFEITTLGGHYGAIGLMVTEDLKDFGLDVENEVLDSTTFYEYLYEPNLGGMQVFVAGNDPSVDPWSDWIWFILADPEGLGYMWNPTWYYDEQFEELCVANYLVSNLTEKQEILYEMQEIVAEDLPMIYLLRPDFISVYRTDDWENWFNEIGGPVSWLNEYSYRGVTPVTTATRFNVGAQSLMPNLNMNPEALMYNNSGCIYLMMVYETLEYYPKVDEESLALNPNAAYDFIPKLATDFTVTYEPDGTGGQNQVWTIELQEGVKWHDYGTSGKNLTADDVVYSLKHVLNKWDYTKPIDWDAVEADTGSEKIWPEHVLVEADGDYTVKLTYIDGWHQPEDYAPTWWLWDPIVPKHVFGPAGNGTYEGWNEDPLSWDGNSIGTGPFKVKEFAPDEYLLLERFVDYWGDLPGAKEVLYKYYGVIASMWMALEAGEIDTVDIEPLPHEKIDSYKANPDIEVEFVPGLTIEYLAFNLHPDMGYEPLQDQVLRQAIAYAIDKQSIVDMVLGGYGEIPDGFIYRESGMHNPDLPQYEFNTTTARDMLLAAGYTKHAEE
jgi:ABC-type transport system substrate-binding protein